MNKSDLDSQIFLMVKEEKFQSRVGFPDRLLATTEEYPTGTVAVCLDPHGNPTFDIRKMVAWDYIPWSPDLEQLAHKADVVCFGSLSQRSSVSRNTILNFLDHTGPSCIRIFDINLRNPYPDSEVLFTSLKKANVLKINADELIYLSDLLKLKDNTPDLLSEILRKFGLHLIVLTLGDKGSILASNDGIVCCPCFPVDVHDSVGAGDSFSAVIAMGLLRGMPLDKMNSTACRIASYICSQPGAMVRLPMHLVQAVANWHMSSFDKGPKAQTPCQLLKHKCVME